MKKRTTYIVCVLIVALILGGIFLIPRGGHQPADPTPSSTSDPVGQDPSAEGSSDMETGDTDPGQDPDDEADPGADVVDEVVVEYDEDQGFTIG